MIEKLPLVYIASPYSKGDQILNIRSSIQVFISMIDEKKVTPIAPLLASYAHLVIPRKYEAWLEHDFELILHCDALFACNATLDYPAYIQKESKGRDAEIEFAEKNGIPVFWNKDALYRFARELRMQK